jgi:hypothetical protein
MKKIFYWVFGFAIVIQFIRPNFETISIDETVTLKTDPQVMNVLKNSCYDCHSQETKYPWYHDIAPVSWVIANHIDQGRKALDFSNWEKIDSKIKLERLERAKQVIYNHRMPKQEYLIMHENAALSEIDKKKLESFFNLEIEKIKAL